MEISPLHNPDGVNAASALENLAHRLVAVHQAKSSEPRAGRRVEDVVDIPIFTTGEFGLDAPSTAAVPAPPVSFLDRIRQFFS